jgi:hypothetical protein
MKQCFSCKQTLPLDSFNKSNISTTPSFIKKYTKLTIPKIEFNNCPQLTHLDLSNAINYKVLSVTNCNSLVSLKAFSCDEIKVSAGKVFSKLEVIRNPYGISEGDVMEIDIINTAITSLTDVSVQPEKNFYYKMYLPTAINSLENPAYPDEMQLHYYINLNSQLTTFFGLKANQVIYCLLFNVAVTIDDVFKLPGMLEVCLPNIKNAELEYNGYQDILKSYPDLLNNSFMTKVYHMFIPTSAKEFEKSLQLINKYKDFDFDMIEKLIQLLMK